MAKKETKAAANNLPVLSKEQFIETGLSRMQVNEAELAELAEKSKDLIITGIDDKEGFEKVKRARLDLRDRRTDITKKGKELRDLSNAYNKAILDREKHLLAIITPEENRLKAEEDRIQEELDRIEEEKQEARKKRAAVRLGQLAVYGHTMDYDEALNVSDETFEETLLAARESHEREESRRKEESERLETQRQAQEAEAQRMANEKAENDRKQKELDDRAKELEQKEREMKRKEMEALQTMRMREITPYLSGSVRQDLSKLWEMSETDFEIFLKNRKETREKEDELKLAEQQRTADKEKADALAKAEEEKQAAIRAEQDRLLNERYDSRCLKLTAIGFEAPGLSLKFTHPDTLLEVSKENLRQITEEAFDAFIIQANAKWQFMQEQKRILAEQSRSDKEKMLQFGEELGALKEKYEGQFKSQKHILLFAQFAGEISRAVKTINIQA